MSAVDKVFGVTELLEAVLLQLPMKDLLMAQKINKHCKATIEASDAIQKALFRKAGNADHAGADVSLLHHTQRGVETTVAINPLLCRRPLDVFEDNSVFYVVIDVKIYYAFSDCNGTDMFLTQPPIRLEIDYAWECVCGEERWGACNIEPCKYGDVMCDSEDGCLSRGSCNSCGAGAGVEYALEKVVRADFYMEQARPDEVSPSQTHCADESAVPCDEGRI